MKFTWMHVLCLAVAGVSAQSFDSGFRLNGFNNLNAGLGIQAPLIPDFVAPQSTCVKAIVRPQIRKEIITVPSVQRVFPCNPIVRTVPLFGARNIPFSTPKVFTEVVPSPVVDTRTRIFLNEPSPIPRTVCGLSGKFRGVLNGAFLGNPLGVVPELTGSYTGTTNAGFITGGVVLPGSSIVGCGFPNEELSNNC